VSLWFLYLRHIRIAHVNSGTADLSFGLFALAFRAFDLLIRLADQHFKAVIALAAYVIE
jgi:hypothetical protein